MQNVILIGFMGSGKTTVGNKIAEITGMRFVDIDAEIVKKSGMEINDIFEIFGEQRFREMESEELLKLSATKDCVIATGGGIVTIPSNIELLKKIGTVIYLKNSFETSKNRVTGKDDRPLFKDVEKARELFEKRENLYNSCADFIIETDFINPEQAALKAVKMLGIQ